MHTYVKNIFRSHLFVIALLFVSPVYAQASNDHHGRIRAAVDGGDYLAAMNYLQSLRTAEPTVYVLNNYDYLYARLAERRGDLAMAAVNYQAVVSRKSALSQYALWHLAQLARATGDLTLEREHLRQLLTVAPTSLLRDAAIVRLGVSFFESGDYASVISTLRPKSNTSGDASARQALALIAQAYLKSNQQQAAREAFNNLVTQAPDPARPDDYALAGARGLDQLDGASDATAPSSMPQLPESDHLRRANIYNFNRDFASARRHYLALVQRYPQNMSVPEALYQTGRSFYQERKFEEAIPFYRQVYTQYPDNPVARDALSFAAASYNRLKRTDESVAAYQRYIERYGDAPNPERPYLNIIDALREAGRDQEALLWVEKARARLQGSASALALFSRARIHLAQGNWAAALADFDALRNEAERGGARGAPGGTTDKEVSFMRAYLLEQLGRIEEAVGAYLSLPDGRNEYYGGRATRRLRALANDARTRGHIQARLEALRASAREAIANGQADRARRSAQTALRLTEDADVIRELLDIARRAYTLLPEYNLVPTANLLQAGRQQVITAPTQQREAEPTHRTLADELLFLGLYDEGAPELAAANDAFGNVKIGRNDTSANSQVKEQSNAVPAAKPAASVQQSRASRDEAHTLAVLFKRGNHANRAISFAEPLWKNVPSDYLLELAPREMVELLYPAPYGAALLEYAPPRDVDPRFVLAIARQESRFKPDAKSVAAARGMMQFISSTAKDIAAQLGKSSFQQDDLYDPRIAVLFGSQYLGNLYKQFPDMPQAVAASYNGGEDNVARWVGRARSTDPDRYVLEIGFAQSKEYVYKVMSNFWVYQSLYTEQLQRR